MIKKQELNFICIKQLNFDDFNKLFDLEDRRFLIKPLPNNKKKMKTLIGSEQASEILECSKANIRKMCANRSIKEHLQARKIGNSWVFEEENVKKFAEMRRKAKKK